MSFLVVRPVDMGWERRDKYLTCATVVRLFRHGTTCCSMSHTLSAAV